MPEQQRSWPRAGKRDDIEAITVARPAVAENPRPRRLLDRPPLAPADGLFPRPTARRPPHLHLDEGHQGAAPDDEIEVVTTEAPAVRDQVPAALLQPAPRDHLRLPAEAVAGIGPIRGRDTRCGHAGMIVPAPGELATPMTHRGARERGDAAPGATPKRPGRDGQGARKAMNIGELFDHRPADVRGNLLQQLPKRDGKWHGEDHPDRPDQPVPEYQ